MFADRHGIYILWRGKNRFTNIPELANVHRLCLGQCYDVSNQTTNSRFMRKWRVTAVAKQYLPFSARSNKFFSKKRFCRVHALLCASMWKREKKERAHINREENSDSRDSRRVRYREQLRIDELTISIRWISAESHYSIKTKLCRAVRSFALMAPFISGCKGDNAKRESYQRL